VQNSSIIFLCLKFCKLFCRIFSLFLSLFALILQSVNFPLLHNWFFASPPSMLSALTLWVTCHSPTVLYWQLSHFSLWMFFHIEIRLFTSFFILLIHFGMISSLICIWKCLTSEFFSSFLSTLLDLSRCQTSCVFDHQHRFSSLSPSQVSSIRL